MFLLLFIWEKSVNVCCFTLNPNGGVQEMEKPVPMWFSIFTPPTALGALVLQTVLQGQQAVTKVPSAKKRWLGRGKWEKPFYLDSELSEPHSGAGSKFLSATRSTQAQVLYSWKTFSTIATAAFGFNMRLEKWRRQGGTRAVVVCAHVCKPHIWETAQKQLGDEANL